MSKLANTIRLIRHLRKGKHEKFAIQKALARIRGVEIGAQHHLSSSDNVVGGEEPHGQVNVDQAHIQDAWLRNKGKV